jgi:hypothetical protein
VPKLLTLAVTWRDFTVLQSHTEYVTVPPGAVRESLRTSSPVTQITPGFGVGLGLGDLEGDFVGLGDFDGEGLVFDGDGLGLLEGVVLLDGLGFWVGLELFVGLGVGVLEGLGDFVGLAVMVGLLELAVGCGLTERVAGAGLIIGVLRPDEVGLDDGPASDIKLAFTACADPAPHTALTNGPAGAAMTGAMTGPDRRNRPAPAAAATCPTLTILTGTEALR